MLLWTEAPTKQLSHVGGAKWLKFALTAASGPRKVTCYGLNRPNTNQIHCVKVMMHHFFSHFRSDAITYLPLLFHYENNLFKRRLAMINIRSCTYNG